MLKTILMTLSLLVAKQAFSQNSLDKFNTNFNELKKSLELKKVNESTYQSSNKLGQFTIQKVIKGPTKVSLKVTNQKIIKEIAKEQLVLLHKENSRANLLRNFILANPIKGRIYHFKSPNKVSKVVWTKPWKEEKKSHSFKKILINMNKVELKKTE